MKSSRVALLAGCLLLMLGLSLQGCLGGGTLATGLGEGYGQDGASVPGTALVSLRGRVLDARGNPFPGVTVSVVSVAGAAEVQSSARGEFALTVEAPLNAVLEVNLSRAGRSARVRVQTENGKVARRDFILP